MNSLTTHLKQCNCGADFTLVNRNDFYTEGSVLKIRKNAIWRCTKCGRATKILKTSDTNKLEYD